MRHLARKAQPIDQPALLPDPGPSGRSARLSQRDTPPGICNGALWFALFTALCSLTTGFWELLTFRGLQGHGEWAAGAVLIGEIVSARHRGKAVGFVQGAWSVGWAAVVIVVTLILGVVPKEYAWRYLFMVGILPASTIFFIRRHVHDPDAFTAVQSTTPSHAPTSFAIFGPHLWWTTLRCSVLALGARAATTPSRPSCRPS